MLLTILAIPALFIAPISAWVAFSYFRSGELRHASIAGGVAGLALVIYLAASQGDKINFRTDGCYNEWDGRSNRMVCDD
ncbi:hypothetical protein [Hoeflea ulvae]|uniref:NADH-Ubiquinone oxidoreductase (complex I) chain 5 N-terminal domain-containing protein n=1 Tax=Hoeflea ulvae TaxID=2983764 RepID=A0ABT3YJC9_9HYPH|nr:hypothetical protein [Hoeflea ulvae]MCY0095835.1 hypothetical protein [Hoeflea ulvae]